MLTTKRLDATVVSMRRRHRTDTSADTLPVPPETMEQALAAERAPTLDMPPGVAGDVAWDREVTAVTPPEVVAQVRVASMKPLIRVAVVLGQGRAGSTAPRAAQLVVPGSGPAALAVAHRVAAALCDTAASADPTVRRERFCASVRIECRDEDAARTAALLLAAAAQAIAGCEYRVELA